MLIGAKEPLARGKVLFQKLLQGSGGQGARPLEIFLG